MTIPDYADAVVLRRGREKPVRQRHPWVFSGAIQTIPKEVSDGAIVPVCDAHGEWLAYGFLNRSSQIQVRLLSWDEDETFDEEFWRGRLQQAIDLRQRLGIDGRTSAYRLVNAESDYLPGLVVDTYGGHLVMQIGALGMEARKAMLVSLLEELTGCESVTERSDMAARRQEGLREANGPLTRDPGPELVEVHEYGIMFLVDVNTGQKTGFYTDQRENRRRVASYCEGARVLNAFSYTGGFAIHALLNGARHVVNVDSSYDALALGERNLLLNGFDPDECTDSIVGDVFEVLRDTPAVDPTGDGFDVVILDPPKFVHNRGGLERGLRGYKDINMLGMRLLKPQGVLATFSCSGLVSADLFQKVVFGAALDTGRDLQILGRVGAAPDHPVAITFPEGEYLTGLICQAA